MKFTPGPMIGAASGALGGDVASRNRYGAYWRTRAIPVTSTTTEALNAKARFTTQSQTWRSLSEGQRLSWKEWALDNPIIDALGQQQELAGNAAYIKINARLAAIGSTPITEPPVQGAPAGLLTLVLGADIGTGSVDVTFTATPLGTDDKLYIQAAVVNSAGIGYVQNKLRLVGVSALAEVSPFDIQSLVETRFGTLVVGQTLHVQVAVVDTLTGLLSGRLADRAVVIST